MAERVEVPVGRGAWLALVDEAERRGVTVAVLLAPVVDAYARHLADQAPPRASRPEIEEALQAYERGEATSVIAHRLGVSRRTVALWVAKADLTRNGGGRLPLTDEQKATIVAMWREGATQDQIAAVVGVSASAVSNWGRRLGCPPRPPGRRTVAA